MRHHIVSLTIVNLLLCTAAFGQPVRPLRPRAGIATALATDSVTIYEQPNFAGASETLAPGDHRLTGWKPASIRVPAGLVAYLYESVDAGGGSGLSVDLLEDRRDLGELNLSGKVSFISVFASARDGLHWARNSTQNGQFVAGHWERDRAGGNPVNTVAVVSPPLPGHPTTTPTSIEHQGTTWTISALGPQSSADTALWSGADATMGVIGSNFRGTQEIGSAKFERASNNLLIPDWLNFWYPNRQPNDHRSVVYFKRTLTGVVADKLTKNWSGRVPDGRGGWRVVSGTYERSDVPHVANITGTYPDHDLNIDVMPFVDYMYLIKDSHAPERSTEVTMKDLVDDDHDPCTDPFIVVESEVDATESVKQMIAAALRQRIGKQVAMYGPWIYDIGHCDHPEIHPAEQIWWTDTGAGTSRVYHLNLFADSSQRFWWRSQMDNGTKLHPWGAPPITGTFAIAFEVPVNGIRAVAGGGQRFEVATVDALNVASNPASDKEYDLVYSGQTLVAFVPHTDAFRASFENVGLKPGTNNVVRGFLVLEATVGSVKQIATKVTVDIGGQHLSVDIPAGGDPDTIDQRFERQVFRKEAGHYVFTVTRTDIGNRLTTLGGVR